MLLPRSDRYLLRFSVSGTGGVADLSQDLEQAGVSLAETGGAGRVPEDGWDDDDDDEAEGVHAAISKPGAGLVAAAGV